MRKDGIRDVFPEIVDVLLDICRKSEIKTKIDRCRPCKSALAMAFVLNVLPETDDADTQVVTESAEASTASGGEPEEEEDK